jgi:hypothetical protein
MVAGTNQLSLDLSKIPTGNYYCKIISGGFNETITILKTQ